MPESWKPVVGLEDAFEVSSHGRVRSLDKVITTAHGVTRRYKGRLITPYLYEYKQQGYKRPFVTLGHEGQRHVRLVHRLVAESFCLRAPGCDVVNHIDGDPLNNHYLNLEWTTHKGNSQHAVMIGRYQKQPRGSKKFFSKLTEEDVAQIILRLCRKEQQKDIAKDYGVAPPIVSNINRGLAWSHVTVEGCGSPPYHLKRP
jgi:hypothetical protein